MPLWRAKGPCGKLSAAARRWASGRGGKPLVEDDPFTAQMILPDWMNRRAEGRTEQGDEIQILQADADIVALFLALDTQWRRHPMAGSRMGIDYSAIRPTADLYEIALSPSIMADIRLMESAALAEFAKVEKRTR